MNPKSGKAGSAVAPADPEVPDDADLADPGQMAKIIEKQMETGTGKYGAEKVKPFKPEEKEEEEEKKSWIEIELVDEEDNPVPGEKYKITLPDETVATGTLDEKGFARVDGIDPGTCKITFPDLDKDAWEKAGGGGGSGAGGASDYKSGGGGSGAGGASDYKSGDSGGGSNEKSGSTGDYKGGGSGGGGDGKSGGTGDYKSGSY